MSTASVPISVIVLGGYGLFGKYVCLGLLRIPGITVWVAGRNQQAAARCSAEISHTKAQARPLVIDAENDNLAEALLATNARVLIHCAGPFQGQDYRVALAAIAAGVHYIDLADSGAFVAGISALHQQALKAGVALFSGASSVPALSAAVVAELTAGWKHVHEIDIGISPGNRTPRGLATMQAILSYAGGPIPAWREGKSATATGWLRLRRMRYQSPVGTRWLVDCDVPDLRLLPTLYPDLQRLQFGAGLELKSLHFGLYGLAWLRRIGLLPNLAVFANAFKTISEWFLRAGSDNGAMHVRVRGVQSSNQLEKTWQLIAQHGAGPSVPAAAAIALAKALLNDEITFRGAKPAIGVLALQRYLDELDPQSIKTGVG